MDDFGMDGMDGGMGGMGMGGMGGMGMGGMGMGGMGMGGCNPMMAMMQMMMMGKGGGMMGGCNRSQPYGGGGWGSSSWSGGGGGSKNTNSDGSSKKTDALPTIVGISIDPASTLCAQGYPTDACALEYSKDMNIFSDSTYILDSFFPDGHNELVLFEHDPDATTYPEVYQAWKTAGGSDNLPTIATCPSMGQWAIGLGGKKNADRAAKLALALSIASVSEAGKVAGVARHFPSFGKLCATAGIDLPPGTVPIEPSTPSPSMPRAVAAPAGPAKMIGGGAFPPMVGLSLAPTFSLVEAGYPPEVMAIEFSKEYGILSESHHILQAFFDEMVATEVQFNHDPECSEYPEVYTAWKAAGQSDNCPLIATCPSMGQWAVGMGGKANALRAAKLALALTLATVVDPGRLQMVIGHYPEFGKMCSVAGIGGT